MNMEEHFLETKISGIVRGCLVNRLSTGIFDKAYKLYILYFLVIWLIEDRTE
jgi:hypothetical protein